MNSRMTLDPELVVLLACPKCKGKVELRPDESGFVCRACGLFYPVVDGIPNFLIEEALPVEKVGRQEAPGQGDAG